MSKYNERDVFVIHGRNLHLRDSMFEFLMSLGLNPISFEDAKQKTGKGSPYILEILEQAISVKVTIIALFTPDDIAYLNPFFHRTSDSDKDTKPMGQSRQNVIFETGMALAINPDRTILIFFGNVREFSDISGLHYFRFDDTRQRRIDLKNLLSSIGCRINDSDKYLDAGDFKINVEIFQNIPRTPKYSSIKNDIINSVKDLRTLSKKIVRNEANKDEKEKFLSNLKFISQFPKVGAILPTYISQETEPYDLHKEFKEIGGYKERVIIIRSEFDKTLERLKDIDF